MNKQEIQQVLDAMNRGYMSRNITNYQAAIDILQRALSTQSTQTDANGQVRTGWTDTLLQDLSSPLSKALSERPFVRTEVEPVAWMTEYGNVARADIIKCGVPFDDSEDYTVPLYRHPAPRRELSDEEIMSHYKGYGSCLIEFARDVLMAAR